MSKGKKRAKRAKASPEPEYVEVVLSQDQEDEIVERILQKTNQMLGELSRLPVSVALGSKEEIAGMAFEKFKAWSLNLEKMRLAAEEAVAVKCPTCNGGKTVSGSACGGCGGTGKLEDAYLRAVKDLAQMVGVLRMIVNTSDKALEALETEGR